MPVSEKGGLEEGGWERNSKPTRELLEVLQINAKNILPTS